MASVMDSELAALVAELPAAPSESSPQLRGILDLARKDPAGLLQSLSRVEGNPWKALDLLSLLLAENHGQLPVLGLLRCYGALRKGISKTVQSGKDLETSPAIKRVISRIHGSYECLSDLIEDSDRPALRPSEGPPVTLGALKRSVRSFKLPLRKDGVRNPVVAIAVPNGPLLAATCMAVAAHFSAAPINPSVGADQFRSDVEQVRARCIITTQETSERLQLSDSWVAENGIQVFYVEFTPSRELALTNPDGSLLPSDEMAFQPNSASDICIMLFTSGTSGKKKIVPLTLHLVIFGAMLVIDSWGLTSSDICLNMMPLFHIGGLLRNIFAPVLAGGSTICCYAFDPSLFWSVVERIGPTWYYASPTMHSLILSSAPDSHDSRFRLICNAAGGLLPSLALQLQDVFKCAVLPSYGMTECMPISTPPLTYKLDRPGTSGIVTGPELSILDTADSHLPPYAVGRICVRGEPVSHGYLLDNGELDKSAFTADGWFDTGDMGYLDEDGYLYVTGRNKEVINRGGEIISPFEVENAILQASKQDDSPISGRVKEVLAFSAQHNVLQEVVGVVLVTPPGLPRVDLKVLHEALKTSLQKAKWPSAVIFMDGLPKRNNKVLRIKLAERASLPMFTDDTPYNGRHWEAICPPDETPLSTKIASTKCRVDEVAVAAVIKDSLSKEAQLDIHVRLNHDQGTVEAVAAPIPGGPDPAQARMELEEQLGTKLVRQLDNYLIPHRIQWLDRPLPRLNNHPTVVDIPALEQVLRELEQKNSDRLQRSTEGRVVTTFADVLGCEPSQVNPDADFFALGGDSLRAGKLVAALRSQFGVAVPISMVFNDGTPRAMAAFVDDNPEEDAGEKAPLPGCEKMYSSTRWWLLMLQLVPISVVYPLRRALQWTWFIVALSHMQSWPSNQWLLGRLLHVVMCIVSSQLVLRLIAPWFGILAKWLIVGRYMEGLYPMWGPYHTRWWLAQKIIMLCGFGCFGWTNYTRVLYFRMMGAKIGEGVSISKVRMGEYDLIEIGDGAVLEGCVIRPFGAERNTSMYLGRIVIGHNATVGTASVIAPGTSVPDNTCVGPNSSSWELEDTAEENRDLLSSNRPAAHWALTLFVTLPLWVASWLVSILPWIAGLVGLVKIAPENTVNPLYSVLDWFSGAHRVGFHYLALILHAGLSPFFAFIFAVAVRWILNRIFGKLGASPAKGRSQIATWRMDLMRTLLPTGRLHEMTEMLGQHYEGTSVAMRMLGAKVGQRVYWPGTGPAIADYHLVNVGNDVVFGSRSHLVTSDAIGAEPITISDNTMIADRVCLLAGTHIGHGATMGSGALTRRNKSYAPGATYVGSKGGDAMCLTAPRKTANLAHSINLPTPELTRWDTGSATPGAFSPTTPTTASWSSGTNTPRLSIADVGKSEELETSSPFGRAFYLGLAPYRVLGPWAIFGYSSFITVFTKFYWNTPSIVSIQLSNLLFHADGLNVGDGSWWDAFLLFCFTAVFVAVITTVQAVLAVLIVVGSKWVLLGCRKPGNHDWDKSSYCQRWQVFLNIEKLRRACFCGNGILGMLTSTHWLVMYFRALGADIGRDCALFANGDPSLYFTEPDLLTLGDRVAVDDASLVGHINSRGTFDLNRLAVGDRCVLRSGSRLLSGAKMEADSCLLEHTLIMGGDVVENGATMQGWPAGVFRGSRVKDSVRRDRLGDER